MPALEGIKGLEELKRAFDRIDKAVDREVVRGARPAIRALAEPIRSRAESLASSEIHYIGDRWSQMKIGATSRVIYVAPKARNRGGSPRRNLAGLLMDKAMEPALHDGEAEFLRGLERYVDSIGKGEGF